MIERMAGTNQNYNVLTIAGSIRIRPSMVLLVVFFLCKLAYGGGAVDVHHNDEIASSGRLESFSSWADDNFRLNPNWIQDYSNPKLLTEANYAKLSKVLRSFNNRKDDLRVYVFIAPDVKAAVESDKLSGMSLSALKKMVDNLSSPKPINWNKLWKDLDKFLFEEHKKNIKYIDNSLTRQGYTDRIILYFWTNHFLNPSTGKMESYIGCKIQITGNKIESYAEAIRETALRGVDLNDRFGSRQKGAITTITNTLDAIKVVYDRKLPASVSCSDAPLTADAIEENGEYKNALQGFANLLKNPTHFKSSYFIVDAPGIMEGKIVNGSAYSGTATECTLPDKIFTSEILPDKLNLLAQHSDYRLYVIMHRVDFMLPKDQWEKFARQVYNASSMKGGDKTIVVVVPYYYCFSTSSPVYEGSRQVAPAVSSGPLMFMPAACSSDASIAREFNNYFSDFPNWEQAFNRGFAYIPKNYVVYDYKMIWNGDIIYDGVESYPEVTGFEDIVAVRVVVDSRFDELAKGICVKQTLNAGTRSYGEYWMDYLVDLKYRECLKNDYGPKFLAVLSKPPQYGVVTNTNLKQSSINEEVARLFALYYAATKISKSKFFQGINYKVPPIDKSFFYGGVNPFAPKSEDLFLKVIDVASLIVSPLGLDVIFDGIGAYYCLAIGDNVSAGVYLFGMAMPYVAAGAIHLAKEPVKRAIMSGKSWVFAKASGAYDIITHNRQWSSYSFREPANVLSQYGETVLSPKAYVTALPHKNDKAFIKALDEGVEDADALKAINDNPTLIDEFKIFHSAGKGDLNTFLKSRRIVFGSDEEVTKAASLLKGESDWIDVVVHGNASSFTVWHKGDKVTLDHRRLLKYLESKGYTKGAKIRLLSCETGRSSVAIAQFLADKAKATVKAPNVKIGVTEKGEVVSLDGIQGEWRHFKPNQSTPHDASGFEKIPTIVPGEKAYKLGGFDEQNVYLLSVSRMLDEPAFDVLSKYEKDDRFLSAVDEILKKDNKKVLEEINNYPHLMDDLYKRFKTLGGDEKALVKYFNTTRERIKLLEKIPEYAEYRALYLSKKYPQIVPKLTIDEEAAFICKFFQRESLSESLNKALLNNDHLLPEQIALKNILNESLDQLPPHSGKVYMALDKVEVDHFNAIDIKPGDRITFNDLRVSSMGPKDEVINNAPGVIHRYDREVHLFEINSKTGRKFDDDVLFHLGTRLEVKSVKTRDAFGKKVTTIQLEEVSSLATSAGGNTGNFSPAITKAIDELDEKNIEGYIKDEIEKAIKKRNTDDLEELLQVKPVDVNRDIVSSGRKYEAKEEMDKSFRQRDRDNGISQFGETERKEYEVAVRNGRPYFQGSPIPENVKYLYVMAPDGKIYVAPARIDSKIRHSSFLSGQNVSSAGILEVKGGKIYLDNDSGHYLPAPVSVKNALIELVRRGVDKYNVKFKSR